MANYNNLENEQTESFDGNYGQRLLSVSRPSKIVTPLRFNNGNKFNASKAIRSNERRKKEDLPPEINQDKTSSQHLESGSDNKNVTKENIKKSSSTGPGNIGNKIMNNFLGGKLNAGVVDTALKAKKIKIYLIAGGIALGLLFMFIIIFAVFSASGTEASGMNFNEVSEYELEQDDGEVVTDENTDPGDTEEPVQSNAEGEGNEGLTQ